MTKTKKISLILIVITMMLMIGFLLIGCGDKKQASPAQYNINLPTSDLYEISSSHTTAQAGQTITLTIILESKVYAITEVLANDIVCEKTDEAYTFSMPEEDVTIVVNTQIQEINSDDGVLWATSAPNQIAKAQEGDTWADDYIYFNFVENVNSPQYELVSTDENVIPNDAMSVYFKDANMGSMKSGGSITIELDKVNLGTTYLIFHVHTSSGGYTDATITKKIEVVEYGQIEVTTWTNTINFDLSSIYDRYENINISISDQNSQYGTESNSVSLKPDNEKVTVDIQYVPGHAYSVSVISGTIGEDGYWDYDAIFVINDTIAGSGTGDNEEDFTRYIDGNLYFIYEGASINLKVLPPQSN